MDDALNSLDVWKRSRKLAVDIYKLTATCKDHGFKNQITRASISIPSNIAEGFERNSKKDFSNFLRIARGSCAELRTQLYIGQDIGLIDTTCATKLLEESIQISKMLQGLINRYKKKLDYILTPL